MKMIGSVVYLLIRVFRRLLMYALRPLFKSYGRNFIFDPFGTYSFQTIAVGNDVSIGPGACLLATRSSITIGNKVLFGPNVALIGGDHNTSEIGKFMYDVKYKQPENDQPIVIEDDVWIGTGVIVLKGVRICRGSIIAAGAVVIKDVAPYSIMAGVPAQLIKKRWSDEDIVKHEELLYLPEKRLFKSSIK